jgi:hypothetical protein
MSRLILWLVVLAVVGGSLFFLASRVSEQPVTRHETPVSLDALRK